MFLGKDILYICLVSRGIGGKMKQALLWLWQAPQNIAGLVFWRICRQRGWFHRWSLSSGVSIIEVSLSIGVSLGAYVFVTEGCPENTVKHELGHFEQSKLLGPLYLLLIGIPSAVFNYLWDRQFHKNWAPTKRQKWYFSRFPEAWADKLGGVQRGDNG